MLSVQPSISVVVGSGFTVGTPDEQLAGTSGHWQICVACGPIVVYTVVVGSHHCSPGKVVCLARTAGALVHVGQLPQPGLLNTCKGEEKGQGQSVKSYYARQLGMLPIERKKRGRRGGAGDRMLGGVEVLITSRVAVQAPDDTMVSVTGGLGVGPVGSPDEHWEVGARQAMSQTGWITVVVMLVTGVLQGLLSPGRVPK